MESYSQVGQDLWVLEQLNNKKNGYFLDIGAYDGVKFSNTYLLEKEFGWAGLLVEAHPDNFNKMDSIRGNTKVNVAMSNTEGSLFISPVADTGSKIVDSGLSVEATTFCNLFEKYNVPSVVDYMSLDIEGYEAVALERFPFSTHKCLLMTVEHNLYIESENKRKIQEILLNNDYVLVEEDVKCDGFPFEDWYKHRSFL